MYKLVTHENVIVNKYVSKLLQFPFGGHSTTMWTEFCHFLTPTPLQSAWTVLYPEHEQKQTFFDANPPQLVHVVIERPLSWK